MFVSQHDLFDHSPTAAELAAIGMHEVDLHDEYLGARFELEPKVDITPHDEDDLLDTVGGLI